MSTHVCDGHAVVQVRDFGIGIAADLMPHIFDLFVRADATAVRTRSGLGIGLALARSIVESHHGTVSAVSGGIGQGSEFTVRLKLETLIRASEAYDPSATCTSHLWPLALVVWLIEIAAGTWPPDELSPPQLNRRLPEAHPFTFRVPYLGRTVQRRQVAVR